MDRSTAIGIPAERATAIGAGPYFAHGVHRYAHHQVVGCTFGLAEHTHHGIAHEEREALIGGGHYAPIAAQRHAVHMLIPQTLRDPDPLASAVLIENEDAFAVRCEPQAALVIHQHIVDRPVGGSLVHVHRIATDHTAAYHRTGTEGRVDPITREVQRVHTTILHPQHHFHAIAIGAQQPEIGGQPQQAEMILSNAVDRRTMLARSDLQRAGVGELCDQRNLRQEQEG